MKTYFSNLIFSPEEIRMAERIASANTVEGSFKILDGEKRTTILYVVKEKFKLTQREVFQRWLVWAGW